MKKLFLVIAVIFHCFSLLGATTWDGSESSDWNDPDNWTAGVPDSNDDVTIPDCTALPNCPVVDGITSAVTKNLTVDENATLTIENGGSLSPTDDVLINGAFTIDPGGIFSASKKVEVGKDHDNAAFTNNGTASITGDLIAEGSSGGMYDGPFIDNSGSMTVSGELKLGNDDGAGTLTNSGSMSFDDSHIHGAIINTGTMAFTTELELHGAVLQGGGSIDTPSVKLHAKNGRIADVQDQSIYNGTPNCSGDGASDTGVLYNGKTFQELMDEDGETDPDKYEFSKPGEFNSCNESAASALPVELISFYGQFLNTGINLSWATASEIDNDYFIIEKSTDGTEFTKIAEVSGNGTTNQVSNYSFTDYNISGFQNFYRLRQVDFDGQFEYFNTILIETTDNAAGIEIFPNPSKSGRLHVNVNYDFGNSPIHVQLYDLFGRTIQIQQGLNNHFEFSTIHLKRGTYFVKVSVDNFVSNNKVLVD